jgi:hypothetical protein
MVRAFIIGRSQIRRSRRLRGDIMRLTSIRLCLFAFCLGMLACVSALWGDPPNRVGRLNLINGTVSFHTESVDDWAPATLNYPLTIGDHLWTDKDGQAEVHVGSTAIRLASNTEISFLDLNDQTIQIRLSTGSLNLRLRHLGPNEAIELDTPEASLSLLQAGSFRIDVQQSGDSTVTVRSGEVEATVGSSVFPLHLGQTAAITGLDSPSYQVTSAPPLDDWDSWCQVRDQKEDKIASAQYVPRDDMCGVEDLDQSGSWSNDPNYGPVWTPTVTAGWAPYHFGHWCWVDPWGWTWIDDSPWGFAPFHYGRWAFRGNSWGWVPGAHIGRAVYAPALVTFVGGAGWKSSQAPGESVGWFPLGPHEPYIAPYRTDRTRLHNIDVEHFNYVNRSVPGAVTVVPNDTFVRGQPTGGASRMVPNDEISRAPVRGAVAPLAPQKESFLGGSFASRGPVAQPPASVMSRPVVARRTPPPQPVPYTVLQKTLATHPGQPPDAGTVATLRRTAPAVHSSVSVVNPGSPKKSVGQEGGSELRQPAAGQPGTVLQPSRPSQPTAGQAGSAMQPSRQPQPATGHAGSAGQPSKQPQPTAGHPGTAKQPSKQPQSSTQPRSAAGASRSESPLIPKDEKKNQQ